MSEDPVGNLSGITSVPAEQIELCAIADAHFHRLTYRTHGVRTHFSTTLWQAETTVSPVLSTGGTLRPGPVPAELTGRPVNFRDGWADVDLSACGLTATTDDPWMIRPAPSHSAALPSKLPAHPQITDPSVALEIRRATTPAEVLSFERTTIAGVGRAPEGHRDGQIHPALATCREPDLHLLVGYVHGVPVATALAAVHPLALYIGAVTVVADARRLGWGQRMTEAALSVAPDLPATLTATEMGLPMYRSLGFQELPAGRSWREQE